MKLMRIASILLVCAVTAQADTVKERDGQHDFDFDDVGRNEGDGNGVSAGLLGRRRQNLGSELDRRRHPRGSLNAGAQ